MIDPQRLAKIFKAIAHPDRLRIIRVLHVQPRFVNEIICELNDLTDFYVSRHLSALKREGLVEYQAVSQLMERPGMTGNRKYSHSVKHLYSLTPETAEIARELTECYTAPGTTKQPKKARRSTSVEGSVEETQQIA